MAHRNVPALRLRMVKAPRSQSHQASNLQKAENRWLLRLKTSVDEKAKNSDASPGESQHKLRLGSMDSDH